MMRDKEVCICFQDSDSTWVKRCGNCYVPVKINYKPEGYEPAIYSETESNSRSAAALEDESTIKAIAETADLIQESEASNAPSGEVSNDDLEIPNKTKRDNEANIKAPKKKAATKKPSIKPMKKKAATKKPSTKGPKKKAAAKKTFNQTYEEKGSNQKTFNQRSEEKGSCQKTFNQRSEEKGSCQETFNQSS